VARARTRRIVLCLLLALGGGWANAGTASGDAAPELAWALPSPVEPVRALCLAGPAAGDEITLLKRQVPIDAAVVDAGAGDFASHAAKALETPLDAILICDVSLEALPAALQEGIVAKVREGTGLVVTSPRHFDAGPLAAALPVAAKPVRGDARTPCAWRRGTAHEITRALPVRALPPAPVVAASVLRGRTLLKTAGGAPLLQIDETGKGRVIVGLWRGDRRRAGTEPYFSLLRVRAVLWAARREMPCTLRFLSVPTREAKTFRLSVRASADAAGRATLWMRFRSGANAAPKTLEFPLRLREGRNAVVVQPPFEPGPPPLAVDVLVRNREGVLANGGRVLR
jgi:hypothetical protein